MKEAAQKEKTKTKTKKEAEETSWSAPLTYEIVRFPDIVVPHCDFQGLFRQVAVLYLIAELLLGGGDRVRVNPRWGPAAAGTPGAGWAPSSSSGCFPLPPTGNSSSIPHLTTEVGVFLPFKLEDREKPLGKNHDGQKPTSLNSGFSVFFFTAVLCFDFLSSSGFR